MPWTNAGRYAARQLEVFTSFQKAATAANYISGTDILKQLNTVLSLGFTCALVVLRPQFDSHPGQDLYSTYYPTQDRISPSMPAQSNSAKDLQRMSTKPTLVRPPSPDHGKAEIEHILELTQLNDIDPDLYTNTRPLYHPPGARGVYGGAIIAQCLSAAQNTVPKDFTVHSMHCYFVLAGNAEIPCIYHVEHVRDGRSFVTRTVQARQRGNVIFTTTMQFVRSNAGGKEVLEHTSPMPYVPGPKEVADFGDLRLPHGADGPVMSQRIDIMNNDSPQPATKRTRQWIRARGTISEGGGHEAHLAALAYFSDSYFIGTISRIHKLWRIPRPVPRETKDSPSQPSKEKERGDDTILDDDVIAALRDGDEDQKRAGMEEYILNRVRPNRKLRPQVTMMVSLDHTIYFHNPRSFRADEWIFTEMESPWAGDGRGLVIQKMWTRDGILIATCVQEGVVRLKQEEAAPKL
ncbi:2-isopropylmalate synthase [Venturia nashicola]|uniref:2-isopropylmalate synthase n=1 Tax=Venturia nashicola TaxID=86259 RepID=A0A4Z1P9L9_9PEZI|nr:2-isopropylmalate synthase [Venturia nashicola]TLD27726.1 2-isopropylmalate synthase [Venturia nashicola]